MQFLLEKDLKFPVQLVFHNLFSIYHLSNFPTFLLQMSRSFNFRSVEVAFLLKNYFLQFFYFFTYNKFLLNYFIRLIFYLISYFLRFYFWLLLFYHYFYSLFLTYNLKTTLVSVSFLVTLQTPFSFVKSMDFSLLALQLLLVLFSRFFSFYDLILSYIFIFIKILLAISRFFFVIAFRQVRTSSRFFFLFYLKGRRLSHNKRFFFLLVLRYLILSIFFRSVKLSTKVIAYFFSFANKLGQRPLFYMFSSFFSIFLSLSTFSFMSGIRFLVQGKLRNAVKTRKMIYQKVHRGLMTGNYNYRVTYSQSFSSNLIGVFGIHLWFSFF